jgi:DNA primase
MVGVCPFHDDHRPSLYVNPAKQIFKCFACGAGGDVLKFVQMREHLSFAQAVRRLAERAGIELKEKAQSGGSAPDEPDLQRLAEVNGWAAGFWATKLAQEHSAQAARQYIASRKINEQTVKEWGIGYAVDQPDDLVRAAEKERISPQLLEQAGLVVRSDLGQRYCDKFRNRLMFPIVDAAGRVVGFGGRTLGRDPAKYINSPATALFDKSRTVYGLRQGRHSIVSSGVVVVVEGYTDCIMAHQFGCENVVATLGTSFTEAQARILRRYAKQVVLVFDSDAAGEAAANRALEICLTQALDIKIAAVPQPDSDPCDFLLAAGRQAFEALVAGAADVMEYKWGWLLRRFNVGRTLADNRAATEEFLRTVAAATLSGNLEPIDRGLLVNRMAKIIGLTGEQINAYLARQASQFHRSYPENSRAAPYSQIELGTGFFARAQQEILEVLLNKPELFEQVRQAITVEEFDIPILRQIAAVVFAALQAEGGVTVQQLLAKVEQVDAASVLVSLAEKGRHKQNFQDRLAGALQAVGQWRGQQLRRQAEAIDDETEALRRFQAELSRGDRRNPGMV